MMIALNDDDDDDGDDDDDDDDYFHDDYFHDDDDYYYFSELPICLFLIHASDMYFLKLWCFIELSNQCLRKVG